MTSSKHFLWPGVQGITMAFLQKTTGHYLRMNTTDRVMANSVGIVYTLGMLSHIGEHLDTKKASVGNYQKVLRLYKKLQLPRHPSKPCRAGGRSGSRTPSYCTADSDDAHEDKTQSCSLAPRSGESGAKMTHSSWGKLGHPTGCTPPQPRTSVCY